MKHKERKPPKKHEAIFLREFAAAWRAAGGYWYKIPDAKGFTAMFTGKRPFDVLAEMNGQHFVIEGKYTASPVFSLKDMKEHQIPSLNELHRHNFKSYVLVVYGGNMGCKVADFFAIQTINDVQEKKSQRMESTFASMRFYKINGKWDIHKSAIQKMTEKQVMVDFGLFVDSQVKKE